MNSCINQPTICQIKKKKNTTSKKNSHKNQASATSFMEQFPMQMPIQQQMQFQNQQFISQPYNKSIKASYQSQIDALVSINNKRRLHPKSKFTPQEDQKLRDLVSRYGENDWVTISKMMGTRNQRQCRERWTNYLSPNICFAPWSSQEDELLKKLHEEIGLRLHHIFQIELTQILKTDGWSFKDRRKQLKTRRNIRKIPINKMNSIQMKAKYYKLHLRTKKKLKKTHYYLILKLRLK